MTNLNLGKLAHALFEEAGDALFLFHPDSEQLLQVNPMAQRLTGFTREELLRNPVTYYFRFEAQGGLDRLRNSYRKSGIFHAQDGFLLRHRQEGIWVPVNLTVTRLHTKPEPLGLITARDMTERRRSQEALARAEEELRRVLSCVSDCVWSAELVDGQLVPRFCSPVITRLTGRAAEFFVQEMRSWWEVVHPEDRTRLRSALERIRLGASTEEDVEYRLVRPDGQTRWVRNHMVCTRGAAGTTCRLDGVLSDINDRKLAEQALRQNEERFRALVEKSVDGIVLMAADGTVLYVSPSSVEGLGRGSELIGTCGFDLIHPEDRPLVAAAWQDCLRQPGEAVFAEFRLLHRDGSWRHMEGTAINRLPDPSVQVVVVNSRDVSRQKQTEAALRASEERYRQLFEQNLAGVFCTTVSGEVRDCNESFARILGYESREEVLRCRALDFYFDPIHRQLLLDQLQQQTKLGGIELLMRRKDGTPVWVLESVSLLKEEKGDAILQGIILDISDRKRVEDELAYERDLLRILMENLPTQIYFKDRQSCYVRVNQAKVQDLGADNPDDVLGKTDFDFYPSELALGFFEDEQESMRSGRPLLNKVERHPGKGGTERYLLSTKVPVFNRDGQCSGLVGISQDITESKQAEEALRASEAKYRSLIESLEHSIFLKDREFRFVAANRVFCSGLGVTEAELIGKNDYDFYPPSLSDKYRADDRRVLTEGQRLELEEENLINGQLRVVRTIKTPWRDRQGRILGVFGIFWDVTEQRQLEAQLRQAQKMEEIGRLAGGVAHDFNNLLTVVLGNLSLIQSTLPPGSLERQLAEAAEKAGLRAATLTTQLLGFARQTQLRPQATQLNGLVNEVAQLLSRTIDPRIRLDIHLTPDLWLVWADSNQLNQVLMNLCLNARDAMPEGGRLTLETANVTLDSDHARRHVEGRRGEFVRLRVSDTGQGMSPEVQARIFEPFFTTKGPGKGTGLGLAMVFGIIKQHQGWIEVSSEPGQGACFDVYLPRSQVEVPAVTEPKSVPRPGCETILLVDDQELVRNLGRTILERYGYRVLLAEDGLQAVELFRRNCHKIDLVILDLMMPRLSGRDAFRQLQELAPGVAVLFASGYSAEHVTPEELARSSGFISKPYRPEELVSQVRAALDRKKTAALASSES